MFNKYKLGSGLPYPLGATYDSNGVNFAIFSANAEKIELCLYDKYGLNEIRRVRLLARSDDIWHVYIKGLQPGTLYGYRVYGPYEPQKGHRFNHHKLLLDPYAKKLDGMFRWSPLMFGYNQEHADQDLIIDTRDNSKEVPKCVVVDDLAFESSAKKCVPRPHVPWNKTVLYETHVKGLTQLNLRVPASQRGTFSGLAHPDVLDYLKGLGVTSIELLPVQAFIDEQFLTAHGLTNYWGYNTCQFFAPHTGYMSSDDRLEFRKMVDAVHRAGMEVILDVVYNHTGEGNHLGPTMSFRGIDNASYYVLDADDPRYYANDTGCGNTVNIRHPRVLQMVMDSLRYWAHNMGVDGFRFDLATVLGREAHGFDAGSGFFDAIKQDPVLAPCKMIAEPWDIGPGGYQLGAYPSGWGEWNDRYRDTVRRFWRGDAGLLPEFARRIHGSSDIFEHSGRSPSATINFVTSHDGFTLADIVGYKERNNFANKENNNDGHHANFSDNYGEEGETKNPQILALRARQKRNFIATCFLSQGTPMLLAGDEFGKTQKGNNNAYCQDNEYNWLDWQGINEENTQLQAFTKLVLSIRREYTLLTADNYIHRSEEADDKNNCSVRWYGLDGSEMRDEQWEDQHLHTVGWALENNVFFDDLEKEKSLLLIIFNASAEEQSFSLPQYPKVKCWHCLLDTVITDGSPVKKEVMNSAKLDLPAKSLRLLTAVF